MNSINFKYFMNVQELHESQGLCEFLRIQSFSIISVNHYGFIVIQKLMRY